MQTKYCFIKNLANNRCYCSKCGNSVLQDRYNMLKHASMCSSVDTFLIERVREHIDVYYLLECEQPGVLRFKVVTAVLVLRPGYHNRYSGGIWKPVFEAVLRENTTDIEVTVGKCDQFDGWILALQLGRLKPLHVAPDIVMIHKAFPMVQDIYSYRMLMYIYQTRGFLRKPLLPAGSEQDHFSLSAPSDHGKAVLTIDTHLHHIQDELLLELLIVNHNDGRTIHGLVSRNYIYTSEPVRLSEYFYLSCKPGTGTEKDIREFHARYPEYGLLPYWENGGRNILLPIFSGNYHKAVELLSKAGCVDAAEYRELQELKTDPALYNNIKELFGLPVSIIRKMGNNISVNIFHRDSFLKLRTILNEKRKFLDLEKYSYAMLICIEDNITVCDGTLRYSEWFQSLDDTRIFLVLKYLSSRPPADYTMYRDYIRCCNQLGRYLYGLTPKNLQMAHDVAAQMVMRLHTRLQNDRFREVVTKESYLKLTTADPEHEAQFANDKYIIVAPVVPQDLLEESMQMHHCVRVYTDVVSAGQTKIYFLRKKSEKEVAFGTIEVRNQKVIQAKGKCNKKLPIAAQRFICKWAAIKGLGLSTIDISEAAKQYDPGLAS